MGDKFIVVDIQGLDELKKKLAKLPELAQDMGTDEGLDYLLNVARAYEPYKYVSRKSAYGQTFVSDKQRRWFFAALNRGEINPGVSNRSQKLSRGWKKEGSGRKAFLGNAVPYAGYVMDTEWQSRHEEKVGWVTIQDRIKKHMGKIITKFDAGVKKAIHKLNL